MLCLTHAHMISLSHTQTETHTYRYRRSVHSILSTCFLWNLVWKVFGGFQHSSFGGKWKQRQKEKKRQKAAMQKERGNYMPMFLCLLTHSVSFTPQNTDTKKQKHTSVRVVFLFTNSEISVTYWTVLQVMNCRIYVKFRFWLFQLPLDYLSKYVGRSLNVAEVRWAGCKHAVKSFGQITGFHKHKRINTLHVRGKSVRTELTSGQLSESPVCQNVFKTLNIAVDNVLHCVYS